MDRAAAAAIEALDRLLAQRPDRIGEDFSEATRRLSAYRDELIAAFRRTASEADRQRLGRLNGVLSAVVSGHFPLGDIPWASLEEARDTLADVAARN
jgi:hypothetical protein